MFIIFLVCLNNNSIQVFTRRAFSDLQFRFIESNITANLTITDAMQLTFGEEAKSQQRPGHPVYTKGRCS